MITHLYSYNQNSEGSKVIAGALGVKRIKHENSKFKGGPKKIVLNWGSSNLPEEILKSRVINHPKAVALCTNKLSFFNAVRGKVSIPDFTTKIDEALTWLKEGKTVCARTILQGSGGDGLVLMTKDDLDSIVKAPLYTLYIPKVDEYRVHVVNGAITDIQRKALSNAWQEENPDKKANFKIRNLANGFIYMRGNLNPPDVVLEEAVKAVKAVGLDFGAVDVIFNQKQNMGYVLEVNCAPGVEGTSIVNYTAAFKDMKF